jgi:thiol-disulfide isomerase/thioredoxin
MSTTWRLVIVLLGVGFLLEAVVIVAVMRQIGTMLLGGAPNRTEPQRPGPELGSVVEVPGLEPSELPALLVFVSSACTACAAITPRLQWMYKTYGPESPHGHQLDFVAVITDGANDEAAEHVGKLSEFARGDLMVLMNEWEIPFVPFVVALDPGRRVIRAAAVSQPDELETLATIGLSLQPVADSDTPNSLEIFHPDSNQPHSMEALR